MGIKGSATIELTNADGSKEIYKHDNMITNAVNDLCMSQRGEMATILKIVDNGDSYAQALFGGLLLFDDELDTDANNYFLPTVKCTGYASQDAYAGLDTCRGSFNASEGGVQDDGSYKFVWDFATSQANGTIKSLALCPNMMGQIGLTSSKVSNEAKTMYMKRTNTDPFDSRGYMLPNSTVDGFVANGLYIVAIVNDIAYAASMDNIGYRGAGASSSLCITNNGGILKLLRFKLGASSIALTDKVCCASYIDTVDIQLPTEFMNAITYQNYASLIAMNYDKDNNKIIVFPCARANALPANSTIKYCEIDMSNNYAVSTYTFTNNTGGSIPSFGYTGTAGNQYKFYAMKDYILVTSESTSNEYKMYSIKRSDNTQIKEIQDMSGAALQLGSNVGFCPVFWKNNIIVVKYQLQSGYRHFVIDLATGKMKDTNISVMSEANNIDIGHTSVFAMTGGNLTYSMSFNPFILCTKNNLDSPITKTASQTMKITYTLSVADTEGSEV